MSNQKAKGCAVAPPCLRPCLMIAWGPPDPTVPLYPTSNVGLCKCALSPVYWCGRDCVLYNLRQIPVTSLPSAKPLSQCFPQHADHGMLATCKAMHVLLEINCTIEPASGDSSRACLFLDPRRLFQAARPRLPRPNVGSSTTNSCGHGHPQASNPASTTLGQI